MTMTKFQQLLWITVGVLLASATINLVETVSLAKKHISWTKTESGLVVPFVLRGSATPLGSVEEDVTFWHYTREQQDGHVIAPDCNDNCLSEFIKGAPVVLAAHGFGNDGTFIRDMKSGFLNGSDPVNLIIIDWAKRSENPDYGRAVLNLEPVGEYVAKLVNFIVAEEAGTLNETHFIGHSLGGHMPNYVNRKLIGGQLRTIFGLDPAWPLFERRDDDGRLDPSDAQFVVVIHTSIVYLGFRSPAGHVDFYPNSGKNQPGCDDNLFGSCSHARCHIFFKESISTPESFPACKCDSWDDFNDGKCVCEEMAGMGWHTPRTARGVYYLRTNGKSPYSQPTKISSVRS